MDIQNVSTSAASRTTSQMEQKIVNTSIVPKQVTESAAPSPKAVESSVNPEKLKQAIEKINQQLVASKWSVRFSVDQNTNSSVVKVIDYSSEELIRQFPTEGSLDIIEDIQKYLDSVAKNQTGTKEGLTGSLLNEII
jgi:flagellar protein FlaG